MSKQPSKTRIVVPECLREELLEFSIRYLVEDPGDVVDFAVEYFTKLQEKRRNEAKGMVEHDQSPDESVMSVDEGNLFNILHI